jgi:shikimate dehydrogenase
MKKYGLIGYPLGHSFSEKYFTDKFAREIITDSVYKTYPLESIRLIDDLISCDNEIFGLNVTIPYKSQVIEYLDWIDDEASAVGAVNVIRIIRTGNIRTLKGFNTDIYGFRVSILPFLDKSVRKALILGSGGGSKGVGYVLGKLGIELTIASINAEPGTITYEEISERIIAENLLIVNCTPLGMYPEITGKPALNYSLLTDKHILYDLVYNPEMTSFLKEGKEKGCKIIGGLRMLHLQAEQSWKIWNDDTLSGGI